jgi:hypothetical protein
MDSTARGPQKFYQKFITHCVIDAIKKGSNSPHDKFAHLAVKCYNIELLNENNNLYNSVFEDRPTRPTLNSQFRHHSFLFMSGDDLTTDKGNEAESPLVEDLSRKELMVETGVQFLKRRCVGMIPLGFTEVEKKSIFTMLKRSPELYYTPSGVDYDRVMADFPEPENKGFFKRTVADLKGFLDLFLSKREMKDQRVVIHNQVYYSSNSKCNPLNRQEDTLLEIVKRKYPDDSTDDATVSKYNEAVEHLSVEPHSNLSPKRAKDIALNTNWKESFQKQIQVMKVRTCEDNNIECLAPCRAS